MLLRLQSVLRAFSFSAHLLFRYSLDDRFPFFQSCEAMFKHLCSSTCPGDVSEQDERYSKEKIVDAWIVHLRKVVRDVLWADPQFHVGHRRNQRNHRASTRRAATRCATYQPYSEPHINFFYEGFWRPMFQLSSNPPSVEEMKVLTSQILESTRNRSVRSNSYFMFCGPYSILFFSQQNQSFRVTRTR